MAVTQTLNESSDPAQADLDACANFTQPPLNAFFPSTLQSANIAAGVCQRVPQRLRGSGKQINVLCQDRFHRCRYQSDAGNINGITAYSAQTPMRNQSSLILRSWYALVSEPGTIHKVAWRHLPQFYDA